MTNAELDQLVAEVNREIDTRPICELGAGEYVGFCQYSRTGWAIWTSDNMCTCRPSLTPPAWT